MPQNFTGSISRRPEAYAEVVTELAGSPSVDEVAVFLFQNTPEYVTGLVTAAAGTDKPIAVITSIESSELRLGGLPAYPDPHRAMAALGALADRPPLRGPLSWPVDAERQSRARELIASGGEFLDDVAGISQEACQPVELGDDEGVARTAGGQRLGQSGTSPVGAGQPVVDVDPIRIHPERGQGVALGGVRSWASVEHRAYPTSIRATGRLYRLGHHHRALLRAGLLGFSTSRAAGFLGVYVAPPNVP